MTILCSVLNSLIDKSILTVRREGLYCPAGDFYIDPKGRVENALITHAHSDHARAGHKIIYVQILPVKS